MTCTQTLLFSATLDGAVGALVRRYQHDPVNHEVESDSPTVDTLEQRFIGVDASDKVPVTVEICAGAQRALVFVRTTRAADRLAKRLSESGLRAAAIHGRLSQNKRERTLASFVSGATPVLVATNLAARGLHVDGVDVVIHFDPPEDSKMYLHRSGRTARAGESGMVVTLVLPEQHRDIIQLQRESGTRFAIVEMRSDDKRLADLASWEPPARSEEPEHGREGASNFAGRRPARAGSGRSRPSGSRGGRRRDSGGAGRSRAQATG